MRLIFLFYLTGSDGALTRRPKSTTLIPATLLRLNCGTDLSLSVLWRFTAEDSSTTDTVAAGTTVTDAFKPYFYLDTSSLYDLVAHTSNANESYCGTYTCTDNDGGGESSSATVASKCTLGLNCIHSCCVYLRGDVVNSDVSLNIVHNVIAALALDLLLLQCT